MFSIILIIFLIGLILIVIDLTKKENKCSNVITETIFIPHNLDFDYKSLNIDDVYDFIFKKQEPWKNNHRADFKKFI
jgi:hypothetical protein